MILLSNGVISNDPWAGFQGHARRYCQRRITISHKGATYIIILLYRSFEWSRRPRPIEFLLCSAAVVCRSLRRGGAGSWSASGSRRQVSTSTQVPAAEQHMGRRADCLLLQGALAPRSQRVLRRQAISDVRGQATAVGADRPDADTDRQLV